jgi:hypothetical protein
MARVRSVGAYTNIDIASAVIVVAAVIGIASMCRLIG